MSINEQQQHYKLYNRAENFSKNYSQYLEQPTSDSMKLQIRNLVQHKKNSIKSVIEQSKFQKDLYCNLQKIDIKNRVNITKSIRQKEQKVQNNKSTLQIKHNKQAQLYNQHLKKIYDQFQDNEKKKKHIKDSTAIQLRKQLLKFYETRKKKKIQAFNAQTRVSTCYQSSIDRMEQIYRKNVEFAAQTHRSLSVQLQRSNRNYSEIINSTKKINSLVNKDKIQKNREQCFSQRQRSFIQTYCKDMNKSIKAFEHKDQENNKNKKRLTQFLKKRFEKWSDCKKRIDDQKQIVPQKCIDIMNKTTKASYRQTHSSFRTTKQFANRVKMNKSQIILNDNIKRDQIVKNHLNLRLKNNACFRINQKMDSIRGHAKRMATHYL